MNFFGALGHLARVLPGYVEGQRQAYQDNWTDLNQYNQVQQGQIGNAFLESVFPLEYQRAYDDTVNADLAMYNNGAATLQMLQGLPYETQLRGMQYNAAPSVFQRRLYELLDPTFRWRQMGINPATMFGGGTQPMMPTPTPMATTMPEPQQTPEPIASQQPIDWNQSMKQRAGLQP